MSKIILLTVFALVISVNCDPLIYSAQLYSSPYSSAILSAPDQTYNAPLPAVALQTLPDALQTVSIPASAFQPVAAAALQPVAATNLPAAIPYSSVRQYSYGSSLNQQEYLPTVYNSAPSARMTYNVPYAYAADWFYRR